MMAFYLLIIKNKIMENLSEGQIWAYFWTGSAFIFLLLYYCIELYYKFKNKK